MAVIASDIQNLPSGEFSAISDSICETYIGYAESRIDSATWGTKYDMGVTYLAAHLLAVDIGGSAGSAGPAVSETAGPVSKTYAAYLGVTGKASQLQSTSYGRTYLQLLAECGIFGFVTV